MNLKTLGVGVVIALLVSALVGWFMLRSRGQARDFIDPKGPVFTGPLPSPAPGSVSGASRDRFSVVSFNVHYGYANGDIAPTLRANDMAEADVLLLQESNERTAREVATIAISTPHERRR